MEITKSAILVCLAFASLILITSARTLRDLLNEMEFSQPSERQGTLYGSGLTGYSAPTGSMSSGALSYSPGASPYSSGGSSSTGQAAVASPNQLVYVWGYAPPPPSRGTGGPYFLYQALAPGMVMTPVNQLNQMFAAGAPVLTPLPNSASTVFVPSASVYGPASSSYGR